MHGALQVSDVERRSLRLNSFTEMIYHVILLGCRFERIR